MSQVSINAQVLGVDNNFSYLTCPTPTTIAIDCSNATLMGQWYLEPYVSIDGISYKKYATSQSAKSIVVVEIVQNGVTMYLNGVYTDYVDKCNECCGSTPDLSPVAVPAFIPCEDICPDSDGNYVFPFLIPTVGSAQTFTLKLYVNNVLIGTSTALASPAAALAYANTNWSAQGVFTLSTNDSQNTLILTSTSALCANIIRTLVEHTFCIAPTFPLTFDEVTLSGDNGVTTPFMLPNGAVTVANEDDLGVALTTPINYFNGTFSSPTADKLTLVTTGNPKLLKNAGATVGTWTVGACA